MEMTGDRLIPAPPSRVWDALNDPDTLRRSIPGCRSLEPAGENAFKATAAVKLGPIAASFTGSVKLLDLVPPVSYRIEGSGQGGQAGFAKGGAAVTLSEEAGATKLTYAVKAEVGGKLAQLGARLIDASAKQMADQFFDNFSAQLAPPAAPDAVAIAAPGPAAPARLSLAPSLGTPVFGFPVFAWIAAAIFLFILFNLFIGYL